MISISQHDTYLRTSKNLDTLDGRHNIRRRTLKALHEAQEGKCMWCGDDTQLWWERTVEQFRLDNPLKQATFEHVVLKSKGGRYRTDNGGCACAECNSHRGVISFQSFSYLTADKQRYQKWISNQLTAKEKVTIRKAERKRLNQEKTVARREKRQFDIFKLAVLFRQMKEVHNVDVYDNFMYNRRIIKNIGEHYGLF